MPASPGAFNIQTEGEVTPAAAGTAKTGLKLLAAANRSFRLTELGIGFVGVTAAAKPVLVELCQSTEAGAGAGSSAVTPRATNGDSSVTAQITAAKGFTSEPTVLTPIREWLVHPQSPFVIQYPLGREPQPAVGKALCVRVTFATAETTVNFRISCEIEE